MNIIKLMITLFAILLFSMTMRAGEKDTLNVEVERDIQVDLSVRVIEGNVYFKLLMLNESKSGFYSLVKENVDGTMESVGVKEIGVNTINQPLMYCFVDKNVTSLVSYRLVRISQEVESVKTWNCNEIGTGICQGEELFVKNK